MQKNDLISIIERSNYKRFIVVQKKEASAREGPLLEKYHKATSSTHLEPVIAYLNPLTSTNVVLLHWF